MCLVCPALLAGGQGGTGSQCVLAEMRSARADRSQRWRLVPKASPSSPCGSPRAGDAVLCAEPLLYPAESRSRRLVWQQAAAVMVRMAAGRGQCTPQGPSIMFPNSCLSGRLCLWLFFLTEIFALQAA